MSKVRKNLEKSYEKSTELGLLNVLLAFEDSELEKIVTIVKNINIGNQENLMTIESESESKISEINENLYESNSEEEITIYNMFNPQIVIREPKPESKIEIAEPSSIREGKKKVNNIESIDNETIETNLLQTEHFPKKGNQQVTILDLDCTLEPEKIIDAWYSHIMIAMIINKEIIKNESNSWNYVLASTRGNDRSFLERFVNKTKNAIWSDAQYNIPQFIKRIVEQLYKQFTGQTYEMFKSVRTTIEITDALNHLEKISICDMFYFENYACEYAKCYYTGSDDRFLCRHAYSIFVSSSSGTVVFIVFSKLL